MRRYETMVLLSDLLEEEAAQELFTTIQGMFTDNGAALIENVWWGKRRLAYEINKRNYAWYVVFDYDSEPAGVAEVERRLKISDDVVRFKTVRPELRGHRNNA